ncbi:unnamed protein product, partial [marine sediment metagenome]
SRAAHALAAEYAKLPAHIREVIELGDEAKRFIQEMYVFHRTPDQQLAHLKQRNEALAREAAKWENLDAETQAGILKDREKDLEHTFAMGQMEKDEYRARLDALAGMYAAFTDDRMRLELKAHRVSLELNKEWADEIEEELAKRLKSTTYGRDWRDAMSTLDDPNRPTIGTEPIEVPVQPVITPKEVSRWDTFLEGFTQKQSEQFVTRMEMIGMNAISGLINGLLSGEADLESVFKSILGSLLSIGIQMFLFASPSKVTERW